jgi:hypothetical protein
VNFTDVVTVSEQIELAEPSSATERRGRDPGKILPSTVGGIDQQLYRLTKAENETLKGRGMVYKNSRLLKSIET